MRTTSLSTLVILIGAAAACSSSSDEGKTASAAQDWSCQSVSVPNGGTVECTRTLSGAADSASYECALDQPSGPCPPADATPVSEPAPKPTPEAPVGEGGGCVDEGDDTDVSSGDDGAGGGEPAAGGDAMTPPSQGNGNGNGNPNGNSGKGNGSDRDAAGQGNGNGAGNGKKHGCTCASDGGGNTGMPAVDAGAPTPRGDAGAGGKPGGGYHCSTKDGTSTCTKPPTCTPGTHPSACGACVPDGSTDDCQPPAAGGCWLTGGGLVVDGDGKDTFGGNGMGMKSGAIRGEWEHVDHGTGRKLHGHVRYLACSKVAGPGPKQPGGKKGFQINQAQYGGPARWFENGAWSTGYWFDAVANDHGEPGRDDKYRISIRKIDAAGVVGPVVYTTNGTLAGGNVQIHPPVGGHPTVASQLPAWVAP